MKRSIVVRKATLEETNAVHRVIPEFDVDYIDRNIERLGIGHKRPYYLIANVIDLPAGYMIGYDRDDAPHTMHIWLNGTVPEYRGKGIFRELLAALLKEAHKRGCERVTVKSDERRFPSMIAALKSSGFKLIEQQGDSVRYELRLPD